MPLRRNHVRDELFLAAAVLPYRDRCLRDGGMGGEYGLDLARMGPHTSADDPSRYRPAEEAEHWRGRDPIARLETRLRDRGLLTEDDITTTAAEAEEYAAGLRTRLAEDPALDPLALLDHVFSAPTPQLIEQRAALRAELEGS
nr:thiamine pyrophosphate-dependent enzyme [Streptomyces sp. AC555_RSS877]